MMRPVTDLCFGAICAYEAYEAYAHPSHPVILSSNKQGKINPAIFQSHIKAAIVALLSFTLINRVLLAIDSPRRIPLYVVVITMITSVAVVHSRLKQANKQETLFKDIQKSIFNVSNKILLTTTTCSAVALTIFGNRTHKAGVALIALAVFAHSQSKDLKAFKIDFHNRSFIDVLGSQTWSQTAFAIARFCARSAIAHRHISYSVS